MGKAGADDLSSRDDAPMIEAALTRNAAWPPMLEALYETRRGPARREHVARTLSICGGLFVAAATLDAADNRALLLAALPLRICLLALCLAAAGLLRRLPPEPVSRRAEMALTIFPMLAGMLLTELVGEYAGRLGDRYMIAATFTVAGYCVVTPIQSGTAWITCGLAALLYPMVPALFPVAVKLHNNWDLPLFSTGVLATTMLVCNRNDRSRRIAFLYRRRYEISAAELNVMNAELLRLAHMDVLTGLRNRRAFTTALHGSWQDRRQGIGVALIDVDWFKAFNDSAGHAAGDAALQAVAAAIEGALRRNVDVAARYGGEEFAVLVPCADADELRICGERLRASVAALCLPHPGRADQCLSISVGLAWCGPEGRLDTTAEKLMGAADTALYAAKAQGRDRVVLEQLRPLLQPDDVADASRLA